LYDEEINLEGTRPLFAIESIEYGGTNARNIASIMMDFSGRQHHPKILPPPVKRDAPARLERLIHRPGSLINPKKLYGKPLNELSKSYSELPNEQLTQKLTRVIDYLLEDLLEDITHIKSLIDSEHEEALTFQSCLNSVPTTHPYLLYAQGNASDEQIKAIGNTITVKWLGSLQEFKAGGERYNKIKTLVIERLQANMTREVEA
jgi:hypothetical protein